MTVADASCQHCNLKKDRLLRCSRCQNAFYCSAACQKADWKAGHRKKCSRGSPTQAEEAWNELKQCLVGMSREEAHQKFQIASSEKKRLEIDDVTERRSPSSTVPDWSKKDQPPTTARVSQENDKEHTTKPELSKKPPLLKQNEAEAGFAGCNGKWTYSVEEMSNISCFCVTMRPNQNARSDSEDVVYPDALEVLMQPTSNGNTTVTLIEKGAKDNVLLSVRFPAQLVHDEAKSGVVQIEQESICVRLQSASEITCSINSSHATMTVNDANLLRCRFCDQTLLDEEPISKVCLLPCGYWDEITDYLICYNGVRLDDGYLPFDSIS